jgi:HD-like signal output (HDOD) protein
MIAALLRAWRARGGPSRRARPTDAKSPVAARTAAPIRSQPVRSHDAPNADPASDLRGSAQTLLYRAALGAEDLEEPFSGLHDEIMRLVARSTGEAVMVREYFPRRPLLLPELLGAVNDPESSQTRWAAIVTQDPVLAGDVLRVANSPYYRTSAEPVEDLRKALRLLGTDGLRSVIATSVMQPVFRCLPGSFEKFPPIVWDQAVRTALAAHAHARRVAQVDPGVAHLAGLVVALGQIVVFRLTLDTYRAQGTVAPRAAVLARLLRAHSDATSRAVAESWGVSDEFLLAIDEQGGPDAIFRARGPLGEALYAGRLAGTLATLVSLGRATEAQAKAVLKKYGLPVDIAAILWDRAAGAQSSR